MPQMDGSIRIGTEITTKQAEKKLKNLGSNITKTADKIASLRSKMESLKDAKIPTQEYKKLQNELDKNIRKYEEVSDAVKTFEKIGTEKDLIPFKQARTEAQDLYMKIEDLRGGIFELEESGKAFTLGSDTDKYAKMSAQMQQLNQQMESDTQRQSELQSQLSTEEQRLADIKANAIVSDQKILDLLERRKQLMQEIADLEKVGVGLGYQEYDSANQELAQINNQIKAYKDKLSAIPEKFSNMQKSAKNAFNSVTQGTKKSSGLLSGFIGKIKAIALTVFVFNIIKKVFDAMIEMMKKGFENFANYSSNFANSMQSMKNSMSTLGNQMAAAFAPIVQMIIPWLTRLVSVISTAMTYVAQFIAILGGKSTFAKAKQVQDAYNKSLGGTAKAADKARGALARFDDLDVLQKKEDDSGGGAEGTDPSQMFEEVPVDSKFKSWLDGILEKIKPILEYFEKLKDIFMEGFWDGLGDWEYRLESIKSSLASIKESLIDIFTDSAVIDSADKWAQSVAYMLGSLAGSIASIGLTIAANLLGGIASYLEDNKDRIKDYLVSMFDVQAEVNYMLADFFQSFAYVFEAFASEGGIQLTANLIGIFSDAFMGITELASKFARDVLNIFIQPFVENKEELRTALEGFLGVLAEVTGTIKQGIDDTFDKLNEVYDSHFKPFFDSIATGLSELLAKFLEFWNGKVQPIMDQWAAAFDALWKGHIQPFINSFIDLLGSAADLLKTFWEQGIQPLINWIVENILPVILPILEAIYNTIVTVIGDAADLLSGFANTIKSIIDTVVSLINGDWAGAWESAKGIFENAFNSILAFAQMMWDSFIGVINVALQTIIGAIQVALLGVYDFITGIWNGIYETTSEIWTMVVEWLTENFTSFHDFLTTMLENILLFFTETWENITLVFQTFIDFINETVIPIWKESWNMAGSLFQSFHDLIDRLIKAVKEFLDGLMKSVKLLVNGDWKGAWDTAKEVFSAFQAKVDEIINAVRAILESFFEWVSGMISGVLESISNIGSAVKGAFSGGDFSGKSALTAAAAVPYSFNDMPHLANGAVIRGGNPFMAVLGDQRAGQTNIEAPLSTIRQAVREEMAGMNFGGGNISADMTLDGETVARLLVPYIIDEMGRQGLDVDILGVT